MEFECHGPEVQRLQTWYKLEKKTCSGCSQALPRSAYGLDDQWYSNDAGRKCIVCRQSKSQHGMWQCGGCTKTKSKAEFSKWLAPNPKRKKDAYTRCNVCMAEAEAEKEDIRKKSLAGVVKTGKRKGAP